MSPHLLQFLATIGALSLCTTVAAVVAVLIVPGIRARWRHRRRLTWRVRA